MATFDARVHPAFSGYDLPEASSAAGQGNSVLARFGVWLKEKRAYHQAYDELQALRDRELADIGVVRSDIPFLARKAAKAKLANAR